jgi:hypothetical protein
MVAYFRLYARFTSMILVHRLSCLRLVYACFWRFKRGLTNLSFE